jgi:hypothetical protein
MIVVLGHSVGAFECPVAPARARCPITPNFADGAMEMRVVEA